MRRRTVGKRKGIMAWILYAFGAAVFLSVISACVFLFAFRVKEVQVTGNKYCDADAVKNAVMENVFFENSLLALRKSKNGGIDLPPMAESIQVSLQAPWSVKAEVRENEMVGYISQEGSYICFDSDGYVLAESQKLHKNVFQVTGLGIVTAKKGERIEEKWDGCFEEIAETAAALKWQELTPSEICPGETGMALKFKNVTVKLGADNLTDRIAELPDILKKLKGKRGTLHMEMYSEASKTIWFRGNRT